MGVIITIEIEDDLDALEIENIVGDFEEIIGKKGLDLNDSSWDRY